MSCRWDGDDIIDEADSMLMDGTEINDEVKLLTDGDDIIDADGGGRRAAR